MIPFDEYCQDTGFYKKLSLNYRTSFSFGQIYWTHAYYPHKHLELWRPILDPNEKTKTLARAFEQQSAKDDAFDRGYPLSSPKLESSEEFLVIRAKIRPVVLLQPESPLLNDLNKGFRANLQRHLSTVAQVFSVTDETGTSKFNPVVINRIRTLEFPQIMFLPKQAGLLNADSLLRLDEVQSVFTDHLDATEYMLGEEALQVLKDQLRLLLTGETRPEHVKLREFLMNEAI